jgi:hypothetical protein
MEFSPKPSTLGNFLDDIHGFATFPADVGGFETRPYGYWVDFSCLPHETLSISIYQGQIREHLHGFTRYSANQNPPLIPPSGRKSIVRKGGKNYRL